MEKTEYKALKFNELNKDYKLVLAFDEPLVSQSQKFNKTNYWYSIKELITGENGFNATEKLHFTIQELGLKKGDNVVIRKVNNGSYSFFTVNENQPVTNNTTTNTTGGDVLMKDIKPEVPVEARLNTVENDIKLIKEQINKLAATKQKTNDDDIPF